MNAPLTLLRRVATSLMLVAVLAFAASVSVIPAGAVGPVEHLTDAGPDHQHIHADGTMHSHLVEAAVSDGQWPDAPPLDDAQDHEHPKPSCCSLMPSVALLPDTGSALSVEGRLADLWTPTAAPAFGIDPNGPRRPPRLLSNA